MLIYDGRDEDEEKKVFGTKVRMNCRQYVKSTEGNENKR